MTTNEESQLCVVRLRTTYWSNEKGVHQQKSLTYMKRLSKGFNLVKEEADCMGADLLWKNIINIDSQPDGVYAVKVRGYIDWETGIDDGYYCELVPFQSGLLP